MQLSVKGKQIDVGDALRIHVETSLSAIVDKYFEKAIEAHAVFSRQGNLIRSDLSVHLRRDILVQGQASAPAYFSAATPSSGVSPRPPTPTPPPTAPPSTSPSASAATSAACATARAR